MQCPRVFDSIDDSTELPAQCGVEQDMIQLEQRMGRGVAGHREDVQRFKDVERRTADAAGSASINAFSSRIAPRGRVDQDGRRLHHRKAAARRSVRESRGVSGRWIENEVRCRRTSSSGTSERPSIRQ